MKTSILRFFFYISGILKYLVESQKNGESVNAKSVLVGAVDLSLGLAEVDSAAMRGGQQTTDQSAPIQTCTGADW